MSGVTLGQVNKLAGFCSQDQSMRKHVHALLMKPSAGSMMLNIAQLSKQGSNI
jgi:hypothetical protein